MMTRLVFFSLLLAGFISPDRGYAQTTEIRLPEADIRTHIGGTFTVSGTQFLLDGKPYQILAGEMHYTRIPRAYWRQRFQLARSMGLNTITTYIFWDVHEPQPGKYDFSGQNDIAEYIREAQQEGLHVIVRPGPYICGEWDLGGYPSWLLKDRSLVLRSNDPVYTLAVRTWFWRLAQEIRPLMLHNGGPILAIQLENEYGSFGDDRAYLEDLKQLLITTGLGDGLLYTSNPPADILTGSLPELPTVVNFGPGNAQRAFAALKSVRPDGPRMSGEYWAGWFDHWGARHYQSDTAAEVAEYRAMISKGYSVNLYMFDGGTSFGWMNGANSNGSNYEPDTTSYDYDAPVDERGVPRAKFFGFRQDIMEVTGVTPPPLPSPLPVGNFNFSGDVQSASLWRNLPVPIESTTLLTFEDLGQNYGYVLYRTGIDRGPARRLTLNGLHDYAQVYVDQQFIGALDRRTGTISLDLPALSQAATLDILVENSGRVNFTKVIRGERAGITDTVTLDGQILSHWGMYSLPMDSLSSLRFEIKPCSGPCFYQATFNVRHPTDTFLDTRTFRKGEAFVNAKPLGRFWSIGPQFSLYTPGSWLSMGRNTLTIFELQGDGNARFSTVRASIFGQTTTHRN